MAKKLRRRGKKKMPHLWKDMLEVLQDIQWSGSVISVPTGGSLSQTCPSCGAVEVRGHYPDCKIQYFIQILELLTSEKMNKVYEVFRDNLTEIMEPPTSEEMFNLLLDRERS